MYRAEIGKIMFQYESGVLPDIFNNTFLLRHQIHGYDTKNASSFHVPKCRTNIRLFPFITKVLYFSILSAQILKTQIVLHLSRTN